MEMLQLRYFYESAKTESFTQTAKKYIVPTTSVSASIKRLEDELGCRLFDRYSNRIVLNVKGKRFFQFVHKMFSELTLVTEELSAYDMDKREIKILVKAMRGNITDAIILFRKKYPNIAFRLALEGNKQEIDAYDIIIDETNNSYPEYEFFELWQVPLKLLSNSQNVLCGKSIPLRKLEEQAFVSWGEESNMHRILMNACLRAGFTPNICVTTNDIRCNEKLIESGIGIGIAREDSQLLKKGCVKVLNVTDFEQNYIVGCYYKRQANHGNVKTFLNFLKNLENTN